MAEITQRVILIADDFGLGRGHDAVILSLLEAGRIHGTSVMIDGAPARESIEKLITLRSRGRQIGLHLNLTQSFQDAHPRMSISRLLSSAMMGTLPSAFGADLIRQALLFQQIFGFVPDFYDGHQHCHCLPGLVQTAAGLPRDQESWMRIPLPRLPCGFWLNLRAGGVKILPLAVLASWAERRYRVSGWSVNRDFSGYLKLSDPHKVSYWLPRLIKSARPNCIIMVHPGAADDPIQIPGHHPRSRQVEVGVLDQLY